MKDLDVLVSGPESSRNLFAISTQCLNWFPDIDPRFDLEDIGVQAVSVDHRGKGNVRFVTVDVDFKNHKGVSQTNTIFMRGASVVVLPVLLCNGVKYTILANQPRLATGIYAFPELPAGTLEGNEPVKSRVIKEIEEELGVRIRLEDLLDLTQTIYEDKWKGVYTSPGACDEYLRIFLWVHEVSPDELRSFIGRNTGLQEEGGEIVLSVVRLYELPFYAPDAKSLSAFALYEAA